MDVALGGQSVPLPDMLAALEATPGGIAVVSGQGVLAANRAFLSHLRCTRPDEAAGLVAAALGVADPPPRGLATALSQACPKGATSCDIRTADGPVRLDVVRTAEEGWSLSACSRLEQVRMQSQANRAQKVASEIAGGHHECWDGTGYPNRLRAEEIPLAARIVAVADVYDALTSKRPYKEPWPQDEAVAFVTGRSGSQFDPQVVAAFLDVLAMRARAAVVEWSDSIAIGEPMVDHDHRILLALINQIASPENRNDSAAVEFVLDELVNYTNFHFQREEDLMAAAGYPDLEEHRAVHRRLVAEVTELQQRFSDAGGSAAMGEDLSRYLVGWLTRHIMDEDRKYQPCVTRYRREQGGKG